MQDDATSPGRQRNFPGLGKPLRWLQDNDNPYGWHQHNENPFFGTALDSSEDDCGSAPAPLAVTELRMLGLMGNLTDLSDWDEKIYDDGFVDAWKTEGLHEEGVTEAMINWCIEEVRDYAREVRELFVPALERGILKSDTLVPEEVHRGLRHGFSHLTERSSDTKHIHRKAIDPSYFPFAFGHTKALNDGQIRRQDSIELCGEGEVVLPPPDEDSALRGKGCYANDRAWSTRYQWLAFDVSWEDPSSAPYVQSYISNIHPLQEQGFYTALEALIARSIPLLNTTLTTIATPSRFWMPRVEPFERSNGGLPNTQPGEYRRREDRTRRAYLRKHSHPYEHPVDLRQDFATQGLQFILDNMTVTLDPATTSWPGDDWHVQGQLNERIVATILYVCSCSNVLSDNEGHARAGHTSGTDDSPAELAFRHRIDNEDPKDLNTMVDGTARTEAAYGIRDCAPSVQEMGAVPLREGRVICFPNTFQVRTNALRLADSTRDGHLTILKLHLVDPYRRIISTAIVPPQRRDWWADELRATVPVFHRLPPEIWARVIEMVDDFPISAADAEIWRREMEDDKADFQRGQTEAMMRERFDLLSEARRYEEENPE